MPRPTRMFAGPALSALLGDDKKGMMMHVFACNPKGTNPFENPEKVKAMLVKCLEKTDWASTADLYRATHMRTKRVILHGVLMQMLEARELRMRAIKVHGARDRTEFKLMAPNAIYTPDGA